MNLTETPDSVTWPDTIYCFVEKIGPFQETARTAWEGLMQVVPMLSEQGKLTHRFFARYQVEKSLYQAGVALTASLAQVPPGARCETFKGGKYARFVLTGSYSNLGAASGRVFERMEELMLERRDDLCIESYINDPKTTPEAELVTEILIPVG